MAATYIILMGMQGAGKGTQAEVLTAQSGLPHVTSGGMFRAIMKQDSPLGKQIAAIYNAGNLIPDDLTIQMIGARLQESDALQGVILDGFPRTVPQAEALDKLLADMGAQVTVVPFFTISEDEALRRLGGRLVCTVNDQHLYQLEVNPPKVAGKCDIDGAALYTRKDDTPDAIKQRIASFKSETGPVIDYYRAKGLVREINAVQPIDRVTADLTAAVEAAKAGN